MPTTALHLTAPAAWRDLLDSAPAFRLHLLIIFGGAELETERSRGTFRLGTFYSVETAVRPAFWMTPIVTASQDLGLSSQISTGLSRTAPRGHGPRSSGWSRLLVPVSMPEEEQASLRRKFPPWAGLGEQAAIPLCVGNIVLQRVRCSHQRTQSSRSEPCGATRSSSSAGVPHQPGCVRQTSKGEREWKGSSAVPAAPGCHTLALPQEPPESTRLPVAAASPAKGWAEQEPRPLGDRRRWEEAGEPAGG